MIHTSLPSHYTWARIKRRKSSAVKAVSKDWCQGEQLHKDTYIIRPSRILAVLPEHVRKPAHFACIEAKPRFCELRVKFSALDIMQGSPVCAIALHYKLQMLLRPKELAQDLV